jgi:hypothetical protein
VLAAHLELGLPLPRHQLALRHRLCLLQLRRALLQLGALPRPRFLLGGHGRQLLLRLSQLLPNVRGGGSCLAVGGCRLLRRSAAVPHRCLCRRQALPQAAQLLLGGAVPLHGLVALRLRCRQVGLQAATRAV